MRIALGVHVSTYEVKASLVDTSLPELGPIASRVVTVAATPGGIGGAVSTALGFMRVQALQNDLLVEGAAVVCENALQQETVAAALAESEATPPIVVDIFDDRLSDAYTPDVGAALLVGAVAPVAVPTKASIDRRGIWPVAAVGACVLAALGGVTAWAMTSQPPNAGGGTAPVEVVYPTGTAAVPTKAEPVPAEVASVTPHVPRVELPGPDIIPNTAVEVLVPTPVPAPVDAAPPARQDLSPTPTVPPAPVVTTTKPPSPGGGGGPTTEPTTEPTSEPPESTSETSTPPAAEGTGEDDSQPGTSASDVAGPST